MTFVTSMIVLRICVGYYLVARLIDKALVRRCIKKELLAARGWRGNVPKAEYVPGDFLRMLSGANTAISKKNQESERAHKQLKIFRAIFFLGLRKKVI